jgi:hypothetical protein
MTPTVLAPAAISLPVPSSASPTLLTAEEFFQQYGNQRFELVHGQIEEMPMPGFNHGEVAMNLAFEVGQYVRPRKIGSLFINDTFIVLGRNPDLVRGANLGYISYERLPAEQKPVGFLEVRCPNWSLKCVLLPKPGRESSPKLANISTREFRMWSSSMR